MASDKPILKLKRPRAAAPVDSPLCAFFRDLQARQPTLWDPSRPLPLAVGMHRQLFPIGEARQLSRSDVRRFLQKWTSSRSYLAALAEPEARRFNLDGSPAGQVSPRDRERAERRLERFRSRAEAGEVQVLPTARQG